MQLVSCLVAIGGDEGNTVPKFDITPSEIAVLRAIHGEAAVFDIEPTGSVQRSTREELGRLRANYGNAKDSENNGIVDQLFPGAAARVFDTLDDLGIDDEFMKPLTRAKRGGTDVAETPPAPAVNQDEDLNGKTVAELKDLAAQRGVDLGDATKKADIVAALVLASEAAADEAEEDEIGAMPDAKAGEGLFE